ncbi:MAG TPA: EamA family transporter [Phenylobacterium sp.]
MNSAATSVPPLVLGLVLASALLHASWNALLRSGADRLWSITVMCAMSGVAAATAAVFLPLPAPAAWPFVVLSASLQIGYCLFLVRAYRDGLLSQVYPIARGAAPLLVALGAAVFAGEHLAPRAIAGLAMVSGGIVALSFGRDRPDVRSTLAALATGAFVAGYMVSDGLGVRAAQHPAAYVAWMSLAQGLPMPLIFLAIRRRFPPVRPDRDTAKALGGGLVSLLAYGVVVWAMSTTDMAKVSGLRETSILFATIIAALFLREPLTLRRGACAVVICAGAILLAG